MQDREKRALSDTRLEHAEECLSAAKSLLASENYKSAANRSTMPYFMQCGLYLRLMRLI